MWGIGPVEARSDRAQETLTRAGDLVGSLAYMSREQLARERPLDFRTDMYNLTRHGAPATRSCPAERYRDPTRSLAKNW